MRLARLVGLVAVIPGWWCGSAAAGPEPEQGPAIVCSPATGPVTVDGDLREWTLGRAVEIGADHIVRKSPTYGGPADLSGRILVCRSATTLYVAGEIRDDTVYWNPEVPWRGDGVELFLDFREDETPRPDDAYDQETYQLLLQPLAPEVRWSFASFRGRGGRHDDPVDGVELAGMRVQDERGATVGYRFEVALPLANFPEAPRLKGASFGFDVALSDSDGLPEQRNYATWSGRSDLSRYPSRFGRLVLGDDPPQVAAPDAGRGSSVLPISFLTVLLGLVLAIWLWRGLDEQSSRVAAWLLRLGEIPVRSKLIALGTLLLLLLAAGPLTSLALRALAARELAGRRELARTVREVGAEASRLGLHRPQPPVHPAPLLSLLTGQTVRPPAEFDFTVLPPLVSGEGGVAALEPPARTLGGVPFYRRDIPATSAWSGSFIVHPPLAAEAVTLVTSWHPDPKSEKAPRNGDVVAEARFLHLDGTVDPPVEFVWGRNVDACDDPRADRTGDHAGAPEAKVALLAEDADTAPGAEPLLLHADEVRAVVPLLDSPIVRIEVEQRVQGGRFTIHGITLHPKDAAAPVPLPLGRTTGSAIPTAASPFPAAGAGLLLSKAVPRVDVACDALADRIWLVVSLRGGYDDRRFGLPVLLVRPEFEDGSADGPFPLESGTDVDPEASQARQHGDKYRSELAFEWGLPDQPRQHADLWTTPLARTGRRLTKLHFEFKGEDEVVRISSIVLGAPGRGPSLREIVHVESTSEGFRLAPALVERLSGLGFTLFRDGTVQATTFGGADRERHLARTVTADAAATVARTPEGVHDVRIVDGRRLHTLAIPLPAARTGTFLELSWTGDAEDSLEIAVFRIRSVLGILLAPLVVLLAADAIRRLRSVHARLVAVCAAVSAVPAVLGFFAIGEMVGGRIEEAETGAVLEKAAAVKSRLTSYRTEALRRAEAALRDEALREALKRRGSPDFRASVGAALRDIERSLSAETMPGARLALDDQPQVTGSGERSVFPQDAEFTVFSDPATQVADALAYRWSRLTVRGVSKVFDSEGRWQTTVVVDLPVDRTALAAAAAAAGGDVQVHLYTPRGFPLAETAARTPGEELPEESVRKVELAQEVLERKGPLVRVRPLGGTLYTVAYDVLRGESGELSLLATALPRTAADALIERVGHTSLLIFGAGVVAQFLIVGLVAVATSRPLRRVVERAGAETDVPAADEVSALAGAWSGLQSERDGYRAELARLSASASEIARARDPDAVVAVALDLLRTSAAPWGGLVLTVDEEGRVEVAGGFRGGDPVPRMPLVVDEHSPLRPALRGRGDAIVPVLGAVADTLSRDERGLFEGAASLEAFPLAGEEERGGALVLLERPGVPAAAVAPAATPAAPASASADGTTHLAAALGPLPRRAHAEFLRALARQAGLALGAARLVRLAVRDAETGTHVAAWFAERLREEVDRAVAAKRPIALLLVAATVPPASPVDVRAAAQRLADRLRAAAPQRAFVGRREPLEFGVAIPEADRAAAEAVAQMVRKAVAEAPFADLRVRLGLAACPEDAGSSEFLLAEAERRLRAEPEPVSARAALAPDQGDRLAGEARRFGFVAASPESRALLETVHRIAASDLTILVEGETGAGKELVADLLHRWSPRRDRPLVKLNCAALPDALLESELFGYERGAFTGADRAKPGRFELADGGTLVLDEIGELPLALQAKLLRVLEDRRIEHLGGTRPIAVDVRVVASTNRDLGRMVSEARFREDLFYRLNAVTISVPPLRARKEDIPPLAEAFLRAASEAHGRRPPTLQPDAMDLLFRHAWPGNVRELKNLMEQTAVLQPADTVRAADLLPSLGKGARLRAAAPAGGAGELPRDAARCAAPGGGWASARDGVDGVDSPSAVSDRQRRLLALLAERTWITTSEYCEVVGVSPRTALRDVRELVERGVILMDGRRRGARYRLP